MTAWINRLLELIYPPLPAIEEPTLMSLRSCPVCHEVYERGAATLSVCPNCLNRNWSLDQARAPYRADGVVRDHILAFKYNQAFYYLPRLVDWIEKGYQLYYAGIEPPFDALVPVPLHPRKQRERGFNQADEIALFLARRIRLPRMACLRRIHESPTQTRLTRAQRLKNPQGAFEVKSRFDIKKKRLLLLDDVFTTGATADACARALKKAGAAYVAVLTIARG